MFLGINLHDHEAQVAVVDDDGNLQEEIRLPTDSTNSPKNTPVVKQLSRRRVIIVPPTRCSTSIST
jgi:predicted NBD/HSP70 family sugar kinase